MVKRITSLFACQSISTQSAPASPANRQNSPLYLSALSLILFVSANLAHAITVPGYTPGELSVSPGGAANYSIPIAVPPGVAGMQPSLSLNYSSQGGNGLLGMGWSLGGLSAISRCPATIVQDGFKGGIKFDSNDRFCMDGQRLIAISGIAGADGTEYRTEINGFSKIISYGQAGSGPAYWKVWTKSGQVIEYGNTADSRIEAQGKNDVANWAVNALFDAVGNEITATYIENNAFAEFYPVQLEYAGNTTIVFEYEQRPDTFSGYQAGSRIMSTQRLTNIKSYVAGGLVRDHQVAYEASTSESRLATISECDGSSPQNCMPATNLSWQQIQEVYSLTNVDTANGMQLDWWNESHRKLYVLDYNGDGKNDLLLQGAGDGKGTFLLTANSNGFNVQGVSNSFGMSENDWVANRRVLHILDYNGDGLSDILLQGADINKGTFLLMSTGTGFSREDITNSYGLKAARWAADSRVIRVLDYNGDGLSDLLLQGADINKGTFLLTSTGAGFSVDGVTNSYGMDANNWAADRRRLHVLDYNGDGLSDLLLQGADINKGTFLLTSTGTGFSVDGITNSYGLDAGAWAADSRVIRVLDRNGDGLSDLILQGANTGKGTYLLTSTGTGFLADGVSTSYGMSENDWVADRRKLHVVDYNADGRPDILLQGVNDTRGTILLTSTNGTYSLTDLTNANGLTSSIWAADKRTLHVMDHDGDGIAELLLQGKLLGSTGTYSSYILTSEKTIKHRVDGITDGLGNQSQLNYKPLTDVSVYTKGTTATYPEVDLQTPMYVVSQVDTDNGQGGTNSTTYKYGGLKAHVKGRGLLGFAWMESTNQQTNIVTKTEYRQDFPFTGQVSRTEQRKPGGGLLGETTATFAELTSHSGKVHFPYVGLSTNKSYDFDSGTLVSTSTTSNSYDAYGNPTDIIVTTAGDPWNETKTTTNVYTNDTTNWHLGRLTRASVTHTNAQGTETRTSSFAYNSNGLLNQEVIEPDIADLRQQTDYLYDNFGNKTSVTVSGTGVVSRTTTTTYDAQGQFPVTITNALGQSETRAYDPKFGVMTSLTGPNGLTTTWGYDDFGRKIREDRADGTWTTTTRGMCDEFNCPTEAPVGTKLYITTQSAGSPAATAYSDKLGRKLRTHGIGFDGTAIYQDTEYNALGQVARVSRKYFAGAAQYWTRYEYDAIGRVIKEAMPTEADPNATGGTNDTTRSYNGLSVTETNSKGQTTTRTKDQAGKLYQVTDNNYNTTTYKHSPTGNLLSTTDPVGNVVSMTYNTRGWKITMSDPDMGGWSYQYNVFGELEYQTDAKNQVTSMTYDKLGRMSSRIDNFGTPNAETSSWQYGNTASAHNVGKLTQVTGPNGYSKTLSYDNLGRPSSTTTTIAGQSYTQSLSYDAYGRTNTTSSPTGFGTKNIYNAQGYLSEVRNSDSSNQLFWQADGLDAHGNVEGFTLGNGLQTIRDHDNAQGYLQAIMTGSSGSTQLLSYQFDNLGNLTQRKDLNQGLTEDLGYDGLNRLTSSYLTGGAAPITKGFSYDAIGNITDKSGVGDYLYGTGNTSGTNDAGPHAVTSAGGNSYQYDDNGNMTDGGGRVISWTSFNKPLLITKGDATASFEYGAGHNRTRQISTTVVDSQTRTTTTTYLGKGYEKIATYTGVVEHKHYINVPGATVVYTSRSNAVNDTRYLHKDHLGSTDVITDEVGQVVERQSFDAWGARRATNWQSPLASFISSITTRGFTGHEQLDGVGLVHMNGRVYDATLGRFLSADPHVQAPANPQSLNRYTYVNNNPLSYTDPSGYFFKKLFKKVKKLFKNKIVRMVVAVVASVFTAGAAFAALYGAAINGMAMAGTLALGSIQGALVGSFAVAGAVGGFVSGAIMTGSLKGGLKGALYGAFSGAMAGYIGNVAFSNAPDLVRDVAHGVTQGGLSEAFGGDFKSGFIGAFTGRLAGRTAKQFITGRDSLAIIGRTTVAAVAGGVSAQFGGGKFANGAVSAGFAYLFSSASAHNLKKKVKDFMALEVEVSYGWKKQAFSTMITGDVVDINAVGIDASNALRLTMDHAIKVHSVNFVDSNVAYSLSYSESIKLVTTISGSIDNVGFSTSKSSYISQDKVRETVYNATCRVNGYPIC